MSRTIHTQSELDAALAERVDHIVIDSPAGVWLTITSTGSSQVVAWGSSRVVARESSRVEARESSRVEARESSRVVAWGSSRVVAWESSRVEARESSQVEAWGSSRVEAWESSRVEAWGSSQVVARESSRVVARESSRVEAGKYVAVHLHSQHVTLSGGVVIDMTALDRSDPQTWVDLYGGKVSDGWLTVYKGVNFDLCSAHGTPYLIGSMVIAEDWEPVADCGNGLHFSPSPIATESYCHPERYLECEVLLSGIVPLGDKIKAASCRVVREVDRWGDPVATEAPATVSS